MSEVNVGFADVMCGGLFLRSLCCVYVFFRCVVGLFVGVVCCLVVVVWVVCVLFFFLKPYFVWCLVGGFGAKI